MAYEWRKGDLEWIRPEIKHAPKKPEAKKEILKEEAVV